MGVNPEGWWMENISDFLGDISGASSTEYCLLVGFIALVIAASMGVFGSAVLGLFNEANGKFPGASGSGKIGP
jgi:Flp pilus assembly pilin Flp